MNILKMLPFLDDEDKQKILDDLKAGTLDIKSFNMKAMYPFLNESQLEMLLDIYVTKEHECSLVSMLPFAHEALLDKMIDYIHEGKIAMNMDTLMPFLTKAQVSKVFAKAYEKMKEKSS